MQVVVVQRGRTVALLAILGFAALIALTGALVALRSMVSFHLLSRAFFISDLHPHTHPTLPGMRDGRLLGLAS